MNDHKSFLSAGCVAAAITLVLLCGNVHKDEYATVSNQIESCDTTMPSSGEADGYLSGQWNLWEFIGDSINRMLLNE